MLADKTGSIKNLSHGLEDTIFMLDTNQLLDEVFVIPRIIKFEIGVISRSRRPRLITLIEALIILDITKTESSNCFIYFFASSLTVSTTKRANLT